MAQDLFRVKEEKSRSARLKRKKSQEFADEAFLNPEISDQYSQKYSNTDGFLGTIFSKKRFYLLLFFVFCTLGILLIRAAQLQIVNGAYYQSLSDSNRLRTNFILSDRGLIYDRYNIPLVRNVPNYIVLLHTTALPKDEEEKTKLLQTLYNDYLKNYSEQSFDDFLQTVHDKQQSKQINKDLIVAQSIKHDDAILMQIQSATIPWLSVIKFARREYINEGPVAVTSDDTQVYPPVKSLSHLLGYLTFLQEGEYVNLRDEGYLFNDAIGRTGIEKKYEKDLRGTYGQQNAEYDAHGNVVQILAEEVAIDGKSIVTSLDIELQRQAEAILQKHLDLNKKSRGSLVILDPNNGEVLSLVSLPTFDNNVFAKIIDNKSYQELLEDSDNPLFNRAISGEYPSGSTFKPIVASAALQEGIITPKTSFLSVGGIRINVWYFPDWRAGGHGLTNIYKALADSVNTYFYIIGGGYADFEGLGVARISDYARQFGLSQPLNIDIPGERSGFLPSKEWKESYKNEPWYIGDTYHLAIGQGDLLVTPLQVATYMSVFANGGILYQPHLLKNYVDKNMSVISSFEPHILNSNFIDSANIKVIQDGLRQVVTVGSGKHLADLPLTVSGKTGTAQWNTNKPPHAWFAGYAPSTNPQIAFSVLVEEGEEGSKITTAIAKDLLQWWYENRTDNLDKY